MKGINRAAAGGMGHLNIELRYSKARLCEAITGKK